MALPKAERVLYDYTMYSTGQKIKYCGFSGKEQKILLLAKEAKGSENEREEVVNAIVQIIENCTLGKVDVRNMATFDFEHLFLMIRAKSAGEIIPIKYRYNYNDNDGKPLTQFIDVTININDIKLITSDNHNKKIEINDSLGFVMKYPTFKLIDSVEDDQAVAISCIDYIYDKNEIYNSSDHTEEELKEFYDSLEMITLLKVKAFFDTMPKLSHSVELTLIDGKKEIITFEGLESFFI